MNAPTKLLAFTAASAFTVWTGSAEARPALLPFAESWALSAGGGMRGITIGPIESLRHAGKGYGSEAYVRALDESVRMGATWISLTVFGRVWDLNSTEVDLVFEAPFQENRLNVLKAIEQAHARGLKVFLVPHLWVESGGWRALMAPGGGSDEGWARWADSYRSFLLAWAEVARLGHAEMFSAGVELRSWVTTSRVASFKTILSDLKAIYPGWITYSANWDDVEDTLILGELDFIGINAFYPLTEREGAPLEDLIAGGYRIAANIEKMANTYQKPVVLTEIGYTTRADPALRPWEWPDSMTNVRIDEQSQADAYTAIMAPFLDARFCTGFFIWRVYADPDDVSQEAEWGFSPRGKKAELVLRDAFGTHWAADGPAYAGEFVSGMPRARTPGFYLAPELFGFRREFRKWL